MSYYEKGNGWNFQKGKSVNAINAEEEGYLPKSKWQKMRKDELIDFIFEKYPIDWDYIKKAEQLTKKEILNFLRYKESHHTGKFYQLTEYYEIDYKRLERMIKIVQR